MTDSTPVVPVSSLHPLRSHHWPPRLGAEGRLKTDQEITRLEADAEVWCLAALSDGRLVAWERLGRLH